MNPRTEALLAVEPALLTEQERADLAAALQGDHEALETAVALVADRELADDIADPFAVDAPAPTWRTAEDLGPARRRRWPSVAIAAAILIAGLVAAAMVLRGAEREPREAAVEPEPTPEPRPGASRPQPASEQTQRIGEISSSPGKVLATFKADTATIDLVGAELPAVVEQRDAFAMSLYWRVRAAFPENPSSEERWRVFVHFDGAKSRFQGDHGMMAAGDDWWLDGNVFEDRFAVMAGYGGYPAGTYDIYVGWFKGGPGNWTNATITEANAPAEATENNRLHIGQIELR